MDPPPKCHYCISIIMLPPKLHCLHSNAHLEYTPFHQIRKLIYYRPSEPNLDANSVRSPMRTLINAIDIHLPLHIAGTAPFAFEGSLVGLFPFTFGFFHLTLC